MNVIESVILTNLCFREEYVRKVLPFLKEEYFESLHHKVLFEIVNTYFQKYGDIPTKSALLVELQNKDNLSDEVFSKSAEFINDLEYQNEDLEWLLTSSEKWTKERAVYLALLESIKIADGKDSKRNPEAIPSILTEALGVSFDDHIGHDFIDDYQTRYDFYHRKEEKIPFDLEYFDKITKGGLPNKTLNVALAGTGVGKSLFMCHMASACLLQGRNVLYITLEMAEEKIAERIDANLLDVDIQDLTKLPQQLYENKIVKLARQTHGKLIIKEYPTASAHAGHFKSLLNELSIKKGFHPDIVFIDYLNICASSRYKGTIVNSYTYVKAIAEELRGLAVESNVPIVSATQTTRAGFGNTDVDITDTSESFGLPATADFMFALISTEELEAMNQIMVKQLKNRYNDPTSYRRFCVGIDRAKMKLYNIDQSQQGNLVDSGHPDPVEAAAQDKFAKFNTIQF
jgi:archaellum biogenesis ATPase FlaH